MKAIINFFLRPQIFALGIAGFSALALVMALVAEHIYDLSPCILCIYQRIPFILNILLGVVSLKLIHKSMFGGAGFMIMIAGIIFLGNSLLAFYHTGVEQHWWASAFEACKIDIANLRQAATSPAVPCDEIPWADPVLGWSMANWNILVCGIAGVLTLLYGRWLFNQRPATT